MNGPRKLRELLAQPGIIMAPGAVDCIGVKLIEEAGFKAVYLGGAGIASSRLGRPDIGLTTMIEAVDAAVNFSSSTELPIICDADNGFGNAINVIRTVQRLESAGVAAIQLEDQDFPKRCGHLEGKQLIRKEEMISKIEAFKYARKNRNTVLIARTDALAVNGFADAVDRAKAYQEAGADILFVEALTSVEQIKQLPQILPNTPLLINLVDGKGKTPIIPAKQLEELGYKIAIYPASTWMASIWAQRQVLRELKTNGSALGYYDKMADFHDIFELVGLSKVVDLEKRFMK